MDLDRETTAACGRGRVSSNIVLGSGITPLSYVLVDVPWPQESEWNESSFPDLPRIISPERVLLTVALPSGLRVCTWHSVAIVILIRFHRKQIRTICVVVVEGPPQCGQPLLPIEKVLRRTLRGLRRATPPISAHMGVYIRADSRCRWGWIRLTF